MSDQEANQNMENKCPQCGAVLPPGGLAGLCPACMFKQAATETAGQPPFHHFEPPSVAELAKLFPQLEILSLIGRGGMGAVYKARQPMLDRIVALKILPAQVTRGTDFADRFTREARALAKLNHPNIVMVYDFGQVRDQPYFIMEYVDGLNLRQLEQEGKLSPVEALQIVPQICEALQFAHDAGIVHRDIKPDNILLDRRGRVKIADFGIAKIIGAGADPAIAVTQGAIGTPHYMAPEQVDRPQSVDHRADIFSLGVVFYEMLTGELPLGKFGPPSSGPKGLRVDVRLDEVVFRALEREPNRRYQHASQVKTAVETIAGTLSPASGGTASAGPAAETILARDFRLSVRNCVSRGWDLLKSDFWPLLGITALIMALMGVATATFSSAQPARSGSVQVQGVSALAMLLVGPLIGGLYLYFLKKIRKEPATVETAFFGFSKRFLHLFLASFVMVALTGLGFCLVLPGIYLAVAWVFTLFLVIDKGMDFWPAMELSRKVVHKQWWKVLLLLVACAALAFAGALACGIGLLVAAPVAIAALAYAYEDIFGSASPAAPAWPAAGRPIPAAPVAGRGPAGTMVVTPLAEAAPPAGSVPPPPQSPPPLGAVPPGAIPPGGIPPLRAGSPSPSGGFGKWFLILCLIFLVGLLCLIGIITLLPDFNYHIGGHRMVHRFGAPSILDESGNGAITAPRAPLPPLPPLPPEILQSPAYTALAKRIRQELRQARFHYDDLGISAAEKTNLVVSFSGLRKRSSATGSAASSGDSASAAAPGLLISNDDAVVSISASKGIQVTDKKDHDHTSISFPGFNINVNQDQSDSETGLAGTLVGTPAPGGQWKFAGTGELTAVGFTVADLDLRGVLAAAGEASAEAAQTAAPTHETLSERLDAAETITDETTKDKSLTTLAEDAATAGDVGLVKTALGQFYDADVRDEAAHAAATRLAQTGRRKDALEVAKSISDSDLRDKVLAELAQ